MGHNCFLSNAPFVVSELFDSTGREAPLQLFQPGDHLTLCYSKIWDTLETFFIMESRYCKLMFKSFSFFDFLIRNPVHSLYGGDESRCQTLFRPK